MHCILPHLHLHLPLSLFLNLSSLWISFLYTWFYQTIDSRDKTIKILEEQVENSAALSKLQHALEESQNREHQRALKVKELLEEIKMKDDELGDQHNEIQRLKMLNLAHQKYGKEKERELEIELLEKSQVVEEMEHVRRR